MTRVDTMKKVGRRMRTGIRKNRVPALAAEVAYFSMLSLPSILLVLLGAIGFVAGFLGSDASSGIRDEILRLASTFLSPETVRETIAPLVEEMLSAAPAAGVLLIGLVVAAWSSSNAMKSLVEAIDIASGEEPSRRPMKTRLLSIALTLGAVAVSAVLLPLLVAGPKLGEALGIGAVFGIVWAILYWPIAAGVLIAVLAGLYRFAASRKTSWRRHVPGAALAAAIWLLGGFALRVYANLTIFGSESIFGPLAAPVALLLWLYITALAVLIGAALNAELSAA